MFPRLCLLVVGTGAVAACGSSDPDLLEGTWALTERAFEDGRVQPMPTSGGEGWILDVPNIELRGTLSIVDVRQDPPEVQEAFGVWVTREVGRRYALLLAFEPVDLPFRCRIIEPILDCTSTLGSPDPAAIAGLRFERVVEEEEKEG